MSDEALEACILVDAARASASRIMNIARGWSDAFKRVAELNPFERHVRGTLAASSAIVAGNNPFADVAPGARQSADAIMSAGLQLASQADADLVVMDDAARLAAQLAQLCSATGTELQGGARRLIAVYREGFGEPESPDEHALRNALAAPAAKDVIVLLVGQNLARTRLGCIRPWILPTEALRSPTTVSTHVWAVLDLCAGDWWHSGHGHSAAHASRRRGAVRLVTGSLSSVHPL